MDQVSSAMPDTTAPIGEGLKCTRCGYNLRGLATDGLCPECGTKITRSVHGNLLRYADPDWLGKLRLGSTLMLWNTLMSMLVGLGAAAVAGLGLPIVLVGVVSLVAGGMGLWAMFLITTPEPAIAYEEDPITVRRIIRICAVSGFLGSALLEAAPSLGRGMPFFLGAGFLALVGLVAHFGFFVFLRRFALRIPDDDLAKQTRVVMWGLGTVFGLMTIVQVITAVTTVSPAFGGSTGALTPGQATGAPAGQGVPGTFAIGLCACGGGLAFLVFGVWYVTLLFQYRSAFGQALTEARQSIA
jgi:hypothetical protein